MGEILSRREIVKMYGIRLRTQEGLLGGPVDGLYQNLHDVVPATRVESGLFKESAERSSQAINDSMNLAIRANPFLAPWILPAQFWWNTFASPVGFACASVADLYVPSRVLEPSPT